ncbi:hypothetical protein tb265_05590 [Gemmatimonadetes bacterium T265]|nr:hypothetical protein tb265_05590 [Gemmatimonadetes bacterium T265]
MPSPLAAHLADRFAADARGLRARAAALGGAPVGARRAGGPDAASCARMAAACDRVRAIFADAADRTPDDDALRALLPSVAELVAGARSPDERNVYAGAVARLTEGLEGGNDGDDSDDEDDG